MIKSTCCYIILLICLKLYDFYNRIRKKRAGRKEGRKEKKILVKRKERFPSGERNNETVIEKERVVEIYKVYTYTK